MIKGVESIRIALSNRRENNILVWRENPKKTRERERERERGKSESQEVKNIKKQDTRRQSDRDGHRKAGRRTQTHGNRDMDRQRARARAHTHNTLPVPSQHSVPWLLRPWY